MTMVVSNMQFQITFASYLTNFFKLNMVDSSRFRTSTENSVIVLDTAIPDPIDLKVHLTKLLGAEVIHMNITGLNLLQETTTVDVTYRRTSK
jgi:hypothetical protein